MSAFDDRMRALGARLIDRFGGAASLSASTRLYDPLTGTVTGAETVRAGRAALSTRTLLSDDGRLYTKTVATLQTEPLIGSKLTVGQMVYVVVGVEVVAPSGGEPVVYRAILSDGAAVPVPAPVTTGSGMSTTMMLAGGVL